jgi:6-phosphogluconolactonase
LCSLAFAADTVFHVGMRHSISALLPFIFLCAVPFTGEGVAGSTAAGAPRAASHEVLVFIGTYTTGASTSKGIYAMRLNTDTGQLSTPELVAETVSPSYLAIHPTRPVLYAANETDKFEDKPGGGVSAFAISAKGTLTRLNEQPSGGSGPCYVSVDRAGSRVLVANYGSGSIASLPLESNGRLKPASATVQHAGQGADPNRQKGPHAHSIAADPTNKFVLAADLGIDKVLVYRLDPKAGTLVPNDPPAATVAPGTGPRHLTFHPNGRFVYVTDELKSTVTVFTWDATRGVLQELQTIPMLPDGFTGNSSAADIHVHPSGQFVYASNRGHDSIVIYAVDQQSGRLTLVGHQPTEGKTPRNFGIDPSGAYLLAANQASDSIVAFKIDKASGKLTPTGATAHLAAPVCVRFFVRK